MTGRDRGWQDWAAAPKLEGSIVPVGLERKVESEDENVLAHARCDFSTGGARALNAAYRPYGSGQIDYMVLLDSHPLVSNLCFLQRGVLEPNGGISHHFHNQCEEMFVIFDGEAQFTIDGRTSVLKAPVGALCRMGHSHAIYSATDMPAQWMNISVSAMEGAYYPASLRKNDRRPKGGH